MNMLLAPQAPWHHGTLGSVPFKVSIMLLMLSDNMRSRNSLPACRFLLQAKSLDGML